MKRVPRSLALAVVAVDLVGVEAVVVAGAGVSAIAGNPYANVNGAVVAKMAAPFCVLPREER